MTLMKKAYWACFSLYHIQGTVKDNVTFQVNSSVIILSHN